MQVTVNIPDHIARTLPTAGESVEESVVRAATAMAETQVELRQRAVDDFFAARRNIKRVTLEEILAWKAEGRR